MMIPVIYCCSLPPCLHLNHKAMSINGALLLGDAIGGALGILVAPEKGSEIRKTYW